MKYSSRSACTKQTQQARKGHICQIKVANFAKFAFQKQRGLKETGKGRGERAQNYKKRASKDEDDVGVIADRLAVSFLTFSTQQNPKNGINDMTTGGDSSHLRNEGIDAMALHVGSLKRNKGGEMKSIIVFLFF